MVPYGPVWSHMVRGSLNVLHGLVQSCNFLHGPVWSHLFPYGPIGSCTVPFDPVCIPCLFLRVTCGALSSLLYLLGPVGFCIVPYGPAWSVMFNGGIPWSGMVLNVCSSMDHYCLVWLCMVQYVSMQDLKNKSYESNQYIHINSLSMSALYGH